MRKRHLFTAVATAAIIILSGCTGSDRNSVSAQNEAPPSGSKELSSQEQSKPVEDASTEVQETAPSATESGRKNESNYVDQLIQETVEKIYLPGMNEYERTKAAFDYMLENTAFAEPVGLSLWRVRGNNSDLPSFVENRSLSVLLFQVGMCEDYAATLTVLLREMGLEAEYVPGLTYSTQGALVDHAWTIVKVNGAWYHLDCQLEQNISRHGTVRYKYFMRGDTTFANSHRWGRNLIHSGLLTNAQNEEIAGQYTFAACPRDYPTPEQRPLTLPETPNVAAFQMEIDGEIAEYEQANGKLESLDLNIIPPVFGLEGYGPQD